MKVIELCGNPGSGKSTIAKKLIEQLKAEGHSVINARMPYNHYQGLLRLYIKNKIAFMYRKDKAAKKLYRQLLEFTQNNRAEENDKWATKFQRLSYVYSWAHDKCDYLIADEGPIQYLTSFYYQSLITGIPEKVKQEIVSRFYSTEYCILSVSVPIEENVRRIRNRGRANDRYIQGTAEETKRLLETKNGNVQNVISLLGLERIYSIDNSGNIDTAIKDAIDAVHEIFDRG